MITVTNLEKHYSGKRVLHGITFNVQKGECFCLLGPNGAGKTTTLKILTGFLGADAGQVRVFGADITTPGPHLKGKIGIIPQYPALDPLLTVRENLLFFGMLEKLTGRILHSLVDELLDRFEITGIKHQIAYHCSGGEYQRLMIARSFLKKHDLIFMDEPTAGIDILFKNRLWDFFKRQKSEGITFFLNTHDLNEAEVLSDRIGFIFGGKLLVIDTPSRLKQLVKGTTLRIAFAEEVSSDTLAALQQRINGAVRGSAHDSIVVTSDDRVLDILALVSSVTRDNRIVRLEIQPPTLNDVFNLLGVSCAGNNMA